MITLNLVSELASSSTGVRTSAPAPQITKCLGVLDGHPAKQQPDHPPYRGGGNYTIAARHASPPRLPDQAAPLASQLRVILHGLRDIFVDRHGPAPRQRLRRPVRSAFGPHIDRGRKLLRDTSAALRDRRCRGQGHLPLDGVVRPQASPKNSSTPTMIVTAAPIRVRMSKVFEGT